MGTSASSGGASSSNPLIPTWVDSGGGNPAMPPENDSNGDKNPDIPRENDSNKESPSNNDPKANDSAIPTPTGAKHRFTQPKRSFNTYVKSGGSNTAALNSALKGYSTKAGGGSTILAKRMRPSASRVVVFLGTLNNIRQAGKVEALRQFNLLSYENKSFDEVLSALADEIFKDTGKIYEDTQDDSITKQAYSNTVVRICEQEGISLDNLTNENIALMTAVFIEESIAQRVICDIGNNLTETITDIPTLLQIENNVYQTVSGLVRNQIMPEIIATQLRFKDDLDKKIENIYRIAFDAIGGTKD